MGLIHDQSLAPFAYTCDLYCCRPSFKMDLIDFQSHELNFFTGLDEVGRGEEDIVQPTAALLMGRPWSCMFNQLGLIERRRTGQLDKTCPITLILTLIGS